MTAIEASIFTKTTKAKLQEQENFRKDLNKKILIEDSKTKEVLQAEDIKKYLKEAIKLKQKSIIELLLNKVVVYKDRTDVFLKYTPNNEIIGSPDRDRSRRGCFIIRCIKF